MLDAKLQTFLTVCETMNYTDAAEQLHLTQPAVSKHIHALEDFYHTPLFLYQNRKLSLTKEGAYLKKAISGLDRDSRRIQEEILLIDQRIRIRFGATLSIGNYSLVDRLNRLLTKNEDMDVSVTLADTADLLRRLDHGDLDFILCEGNFSKTEYNHRMIREVPLLIFCSADLDTTSVHNLEDLFDQTVLLREVGSGTREIFETRLREMGHSIRSFRNYHEINSPEVILKVLAAGHGFSVMYEDVGKEMVEKGILKAVPLDDLRLSHEFNVVWKKDSLYGDDYHRYAEYLMRPVE